MRPTLSSALVFAVAAALAGAARAGEEKIKKKPEVKVLVLERTLTRWERSEKDKGNKGESGAAGKLAKRSEKQYTVKLAAGRLREVLAAEDRATIVRSDLGVIWFVDTKNRTYREMKFKDVEDQKAEAVERLRRRLPIIDDAEASRRIKALLGLEGKPPELGVEYPGKTREIAGEKCRNAIVKLGGKVLFTGWLSERDAPAADPRLLRLGCYLPEAAARKLAAIKGLLMAATFPLPGGARMEIGTTKVTENVAAPGDFDDPGELGYKRLGKRKKPEAKESSEKSE